MDEREEAVRLLKESKDIAASAPGSDLDLNQPRLSKWSSHDDRWLATVALWYVTNDHNQNQGGPVDLIWELQERVQRNFGIDDSEVS